MSDRAFFVVIGAIILSIVGVTIAAFVFLIAPLASSQDSGGASQSQCQTFPQTGKSVCGIFLTYWTEHGGVTRQGLPISNEFQEVSSIDNKTYTVQYFERVVLEYHTENEAPYDVLLSLLGTIQYTSKYPTGAPGLELLPPEMKAEGGAFFKLTGKEVRGLFLDYWLANGGPLQYGYPISNAFIERSSLDRVDRVVQYFERAVFELHTENPPPNNVQVALLGRFGFNQKYPNGVPVLATPTR